MFAKWIAAGFSLLVLGCTVQYEAEEGYHSWSFVGMQNDSVAVVKVSYIECGHIHDNHFMSMQDGDRFEETISEYYYPVKVSSYWVGAKNSSAEDLLSDTLSGAPAWTLECLARGAVDEKTYCIDKVDLDDFGACALAIRDEKSTLDSLEFFRCDGFEDKNKVKFESNYLNVDKSFYRIDGGKFPSQSPVLRVVEENRSVKFIDKDGDYIIYGGMP